MAADSSNPNWFPPPRPKPPSAVPPRKIILGTLLPLIVLAVGGVLAFRQYQDSTKSGRSITAFYSCLQKEGIIGVPSGDNGLTAAENCLYRLPKTASIADQQSDSPKVSFAACISHALESAIQAARNGPTGFSRGRSGQSNRSAIVQCQTISEGAANGGTSAGNRGSRGGQTPTVLTPTTTTPPDPAAPTTTGPPVA